MMWAEPGGWPDLHGFRGIAEGGVDERDEHDEHVDEIGGNRGYKHTHTQAVPIVLVGRKHQLDRVCGKRPFGRVPNKEIDNTQIEFQRARDQPKIELQKQAIFKLIELLEWKRSGCRGALDTIDLAT